MLSFCILFIDTKCTIYLGIDIMICVLKKQNYLLIIKVFFSHLLLEKLVNSPKPCYE